MVDLPIPATVARERPIYPLDWEPAHVRRPLGRAERPPLIAVGHVVEVARSCYRALRVDASSTRVTVQAAVGANGISPSEHPLATLLEPELVARDVPVDQHLDEFGLI